MKLTPVLVLAGGIAALATVWTSRTNPARAIGAWGAEAPVDTVFVSMLPGEQVGAAPIVWRTTVPPRAGPPTWSDGPVLRAIASTGDSLILVDPAEHSLAVLSASTGQVTEWRGGLGQGEEGFFRPQGAAISSGRLWVADAGNRRISALRTPDRRFSALEVRGELQAIAGAGKTLLIAIRESVEGTTIWSIVAEGSPAGEVIELERIPGVRTYRNFRGMSVAADGMIAVVGSDETVDVYSPTGRQVFALRPASADGHLPPRLSPPVVGPILHIAAAAARPNHWWIVSPAYLICVDARSGTVRSQWRLPFASPNANAIRQITAVSDGLIAYHVLLEEVIRYRVSC